MFAHEDVAKQQSKLEEPLFAGQVRVACSISVVEIITTSGSPQQSSIAPVANAAERFSRNPRITKGTQMYPEVPGN